MIQQDKRGWNMNSQIFKKLAETDTPTVCNAIELAQGKRGFRSFTCGHWVSMHNTAQVAMGFARTAKIAAESPAPRSHVKNKAVRMDYYLYMSQGVRPAICVIEDIDPYPSGAFWGEVNTNVHRGFGISGTLTNGAIRDFGCCPKDYQVIGGVISPSHRFVHVIDTGMPVNVFGMDVAEGDFVHADRNGACVVPADILPKIDEWISRMQELEDLIIKPAKSADFDFERFATAWADLEEKRV